MKGVYCVKNPEGKLYIGSTIDFERRKTEYKSLKSIGPKVKASIETYGFDQHQMFIIQVCEEGELLEKEQMFIDFYNPELNTRKKANRPSARVRKKMSKAQTGKKHSEETKKKLSKAKAGENNPFYGRKGKDNPSSIPILQLDKEGNIIQEWFGVREAAKQLGIDHGSIIKCCKGKYKACGGFRWEYKSL